MHRTSRLRVGMGVPDYAANDGIRAWVRLRVRCEFWESALRFSCGDGRLRRAWFVVAAAGGRDQYEPVVSAWDEFEFVRIKSKMN